MNEIEWQDGALYTAIWGSANKLFSIVSIEDFDLGNRQLLAEIIHRGTIEAPDSLKDYVMSESQKKGREFSVYAVSTITAGFTGTAEWYGEKVRESSRKRKVTKALAMGQDRLSKDWSSDEVAELVLAELKTLPKPMDNNDDTWTLADIMSLKIDEEPFTLPGMLKRNERLVLTGSEGGGKSVFIYQMLTGAAFGIDTFTQEKVEPKRVLFLDVENNEFQARGNLDKIVPTLRNMSPEADPEWRSMKRRVVDLLATRDRLDVLRRIVHYQPDILYMGTAYKLTDPTDDTHKSVRAIQSVVDQIRQEVNCTVIVEHHAGHGVQNDRNNMRPEGSSYWLRWPDFGYGMMPLKTKTGDRLMRLGAWRGDRATDRKFPVAVRQGSVMPWVPIYEDEWDALYSHYDN
tara:strand:+ start:307 stop:1512 length:1206 start_codon:yes stop_codon:yes gene_type:complete